MCGFFKRNCLELQKFLPLTQSWLGFAARSYGDLSSWHWNLEPSVGQGLLAPETSLLNICPPHVDVGPAHSVSPPLRPFRMNVVSLIPQLSDSIQVNFWWFWVMVVLQFSCNFDVVGQGNKHVYLCRHLDWKSPLYFLFVREVRRAEQRRKNKYKI